MDRVIFSERFVLLQGKGVFVLDRKLGGHRTFVNSVDSTFVCVCKLCIFLESYYFIITVFVLC